ncbi:hypothetical protein Tco_0036599 [Tanacetum coccineum]
MDYAFKTTREISSLRFPNNGSYGDDGQKKKVAAVSLLKIECVWPILVVVFKRSLTENVFCLNCALWKAANVEFVPAGSSSGIPADYVSAGHVLVSADRDRIC